MTKYFLSIAPSVVDIYLVMNAITMITWAQTTVYSERKKMILMECSLPSSTDESGVEEEKPLSSLTRNMLKSKFIKE